MLVSPEKVKLGWLVVAPDVEADFKSIHGTATCLPLLVRLEVEPAEELELNPLELEPLDEPEGLVLPPLGSVELVPLLDDPGEVLAPVLEAADELSEIIANSSRPEAVLTISSLMVPSDSPDEPVIEAPLSWLTFTSWWPIRPVALRCRPIQPDCCDCSAADP